MGCHLCQYSSLDWDRLSCFSVSAVGNREVFSLRQHSDFINAISTFLEEVLMTQSELAQKYDEETERRREEKKAYKAKLEELAKASHYLPKPVSKWFRKYCPECGSRLNRNKITWVEPVPNLPEWGLIHYTCQCGYEYAVKKYYGGID